MIFFEPYCSPRKFAISPRLLKKIDFDILGVVPLEKFHRIPSSREKKGEQRSTRNFIFAGTPVKKLNSSVCMCARITWLMLGTQI
jgi:hypothetical protein